MNAMQKYTKNFTLNMRGVVNVNHRLSRIFVRIFDAT